MMFCDGPVNVGYDTMCPSFEQQLDALMSVVEIILKEAASAT